MGTYLNYFIGVKTEDGFKCEQTRNRYVQGTMRDFLSWKQFDRGFPECMNEDIETSGTWGKSYVTASEVYGFIKDSINSIKNRMMLVQEKNMYSLFKGIIKDREYEDIEMESCENLLDPEREGGYNMQEILALSEFVGAAMAIAETLVEEAYTKDVYIIYYFD